jgi:GNAT superfamily N-acetyltransferase
MKTEQQTGASKDFAIHIRPVVSGDWPIIVQLFGDKGACGGCWCMWPRVPRGGKLWQDLKGAKNRERFRRLVRAGKVHGVLAFCGETPVGWCSFGPRRTFPRLETIRALKRDWSEGTWSIVCFYVPAAWRGHGIASRLLDAATKRAWALGAHEIEGYPAIPNKPPEPLPAVFAWTGVPALFERAGYSALPRPKASRTIFVKHGRKR